MSTDDAWSIQDTQSTPAAGEQTGPGNAAWMQTGAGAGPSLGLSPDAGTAVVPGPDGGFGALVPQPSAPPHRLLWLIVAGLMLIAGALQAAYLFTMPPTGNRLIYLYLSDDAYYGVRAALLLACGVLLLLRRTREFAAGLVLATALILLARFFPELRPSVVSHRSALVGEWFYVVACALTVIAGFVALGGVLAFRPQPVHRRQSRADRATAVLVGFAGAGVWFIGEALDWVRTDLHTSTLSYTYSKQCCSWSEVDTWNKTAIAAAGVSMLVLAVFAATLRSRALAAGLLIGAVLIPVSEVTQLAIGLVAPLQATVGINAPQSTFGDVSVHYTPLVGFWLGVFGLILLVAAGVARLLLGPRENPYGYPELQRAG